MPDPVIPLLVKSLRDEEGVVHWMYLDSNGIVTVGAGHALPSVADALRLEWEYPHDHIAHDWQAVRGADPDKLPAHYEALTTCRLTDPQIDALLAQDIADQLVLVRFDFHDFDLYPLPARQALADMSFNLGEHKLVSKFPQFCMAVKGRNWSGAASQCHRNGISDARNNATRALLLSAAAL